MSDIRNGVIIFNPQPDGVCELCGQTADVRPYGVNGENICHPCGMKNKAATEKQMDKRFFEKVNVIDPSSN